MWLILLVISAVAQDPDAQVDAEEFAEMEQKFDEATLHLAQLAERLEQAAAADAVAAEAEDGEESEEDGDSGDERGEEAETDPGVEPEEVAEIATDDG
jgi:hypothetical protein